MGWVFGFMPRLLCKQGNFKRCLGVLTLIEAWQCNISKNSSTLGLSPRTTLHVDQDDTITWKLTSSSRYPTASSCKTQFVSVPTPIWKVWAHLSARSLDGLSSKIGFWRPIVVLWGLGGQIAAYVCFGRWPNCGLMYALEGEAETGTHLLLHCWLSLRVWRLVKILVWPSFFWPQLMAWLRWCSMWITWCRMGREGAKKWLRSWY